MEFDIRKRSYHVISGRLRTEIFGLKNNPDVALSFKQFFSSIRGLLYIEANTISGKILLQFDENIISLQELCFHISKFEEELFKQFYGFNNVNEENGKEAEPWSTFSQVAVGYDFPFEQKKDQRTLQNIVGSILASLPKGQLARAPSEEKVPLPLVLSVTSLGVLGIKQLFFGKSLLARHPIPFYIAAALSVSTGYSFIKKRLRNIGRSRRFNIDLWLSASALTLALIRENLLVLAGLSLIQYLNWKSKNTTQNELMDQEFVSEEIEAYSRNSAKFGAVGAAVGFVATRNPLVPLGVMLAANPRPITVSTEYAWKQAELAAKENKYEIPTNGSVYELAHAKCIVFEDASLLLFNGEIRKECIPILSYLKEGKVAVINNELNLNLEELEKKLLKFGVQLTPHQELNIKTREDVLVVVADQQKEKNKVISFYPYCTFKQLSTLDKTMETSKELKKMIKVNMWITRMWNLAGSVMAVPLFISAPLINLIGDALSLTFMSTAKDWTQKRFAPLRPKQEERSFDGAAKIPWHSKNTEDILEFYKIEAHQGMSVNQVNQAFPIYGKNQLASKVRSPWVKTYLGQFKEFTTQVLGATALLSGFTGHVFDGIIMGTILLINAAIGTFQERKAERAVETMSQFVPPNCRVLRDGTLKEIAASDLVPGDIVELEAGDRIPADLRILQAWSLEANESALTGESLPVAKKETLLSEKTPISDRANMLYMGTHITRGKCRAIVVQTGKKTEMGHLLALLSDDEDHTTPLQKQVTAISKKFMKAALVVGVIVFITGLLRGIPITEMVTTSVALTASAIPEGLPITITFALTAGIFRMANKKALVRKLSALETLGRATVICSDKTGTITKNEMTVKRIVTIDNEIEVTGDGYGPEGTIQETINSKEVNRLLEIALLCNDSQLYQKDGRWNVKGDPTEGALLSLAAKRGLLKDNFSHWKRAGEIPFDSNIGKMSIVCHEENKENQCFVMSKGSVEKLLPHCSHYLKNGKVYPLTNKIRDEITVKNDSLAKNALRVLGFAYRELEAFNGKVEEVDRHLIFVGMVGMIDPPKPEVEKSIREAVELGIKPVMITGDHPLTAVAIAKQIGIFDDQKKVVTGQELDNLSDEELNEMIDTIAIYARVTPEHKLRIVTALQEKGHVVAMTGDGVNDSPAIKKADVGIAMGQTGTQVTKETADMVLKEDHFGSIVYGVKEGRTIIGNIRKAIGCLLSGNLAEILVSSVAVMAGMPLPVVPVQILLMNMLTDALPAMILAINPGKKTKETRRQEIIDSTLYKQVITRGVILGGGALGLFIWGLKSGMALGAAQTVAFATLVAGQLIQTFSWRHAGSGESLNDLKKDRFLVGALGISWLSLLSVIYFPPFARIFKTTALPIWNWAPILLVSMAAARLSKPVSNLWISRVPTVQMLQSSVA